MNTLCIHSLDERCSRMFDCLDQYRMDDVLIGRQNVFFAIQAKIRIVSPVFSSISFTIRKLDGDISYIIVHSDISECLLKPNDSGIFLFEDFHRAEDGLHVANNIEFIWNLSTRSYNDPYRPFTLFENIEPGYQYCELKKHV